MLGGHHNRRQHGRGEKFGIAEIVNCLQGELRASIARSAAPGLDREKSVGNQKSQCTARAQHVGHGPGEGVVQIDPAREAELLSQAARPLSAENLGPHVGWIGDHCVETGRPVGGDAASAGWGFWPAAAAARKSPSTSVNCLTAKRAQNRRRRLRSPSVGFVSDQRQPLGELGRHGLGERRQQGLRRRRPDPTPVGRSPAVAFGPPAIGPESGPVPAACNEFPAFWRTGDRTACLRSVRCPCGAFPVVLEGWPKLPHGGGGECKIVPLNVARPTKRRQAASAKEPPFRGGRESRNRPMVRGCWLADFSLIGPAVADWGADFPIFDLRLSRF